MLAKKNSQNETISVDAYLESESVAEIKHELIDGKIYAMAGASKNHQRIAGNFYAGLRNHLVNQPCEAFGSDIKVKVGDNFFYPDAMVVCNDNEENDYYTDSPVIIIEVLSKSTRKNDKTSKLIAYLNIPSLQEYVMIEQDFVGIEILRKKEHWSPRNYFLGDEVNFESINLTLKVEEIYQRVNNEDMLEWLASKQPI